MAGPIEFYFDFSSPYGYLAAQRIEDVAGEHGRQVVWKPFLLGVAMKATGQQPLLTIPMKGDYAARDLARSARLYDLPFEMPENFPFLSIAACRAYYWIAKKNKGQAKELARMLYLAAFGEGLDISGAAAVAEIAAGLGHDEDKVLAALEDPAVKERLKTEVDAAIKKGVFGSPFFIVDREPFWGYDRMDDLSIWLDTGGW